MLLGSICGKLAFASDVLDWLRVIPLSTRTELQKLFFFFPSFFPCAIANNVVC